MGVGLEAGDHLDAALAAAKTGDGDGLVTLYRWVHPDLVRYLTSRAGGDGEDLAADVWMEVARVLPRFEGGPHDLRRFIFSTAHRRSVDRFRRLGRRRTDPTELGLLVQVCGPDETERSVMAGLEGDDAARLITRLLPPNQAEVILLRVVAGLSVPEVAEAIGRRPGAVSVLQCRALHTLQKKLKDPERLRRFLD